MNVGRAPTRIGGDGILPFLDVPHWLFVEVARALRHHRVVFEVRHGCRRRADSDDPDHHWHRLVFPSVDPAFVQAVVDQLRPPAP